MNNLPHTQIDYYLISINPNEIEIFKSITVYFS